MKGRNGNRKTTFTEMVSRIEPENAEALMMRAVGANRLAKVLSGKQRAAAYQIKADLVRRLVEKMPNQAEVSTDGRFEYLSYLVVGLRGRRTRLHVPARQLRSSH